MSHPVVYLNRDAPYMGTEVSFDKSINQIQMMLEKHGCTRVAWQRDTRGEYPLVSLLFEKDNIPYIIEFPVIYRKSDKKLMMQAGARVIHDRIKALLIEQELGLLDFSQAMMQFIALPDGRGGVTSMQNALEGQADRLRGGSFDIRYMLPGGRP
jgi:hypothetical protein